MTKTALALLIVPPVAVFAITFERFVDPTLPGDLMRYAAAAVFLVPTLIGSTAIAMFVNRLQKMKARGPAPK